MMVVLVKVMVAAVLTIIYGGCELIDDLDGGAHDGDGGGGDGDGDIYSGANGDYDWRRACLMDEGWW